MAIQFHEGVILFVDGQIAMDPACCCGFPCLVSISFSWSYTEPAMGPGVTSETAVFVTVSPDGSGFVSYDGVDDQGRDYNLSFTLSSGAASTVTVVVDGLGTFSGTSTTSWDGSCSAASLSGNFGDISNGWNPAGANEFDIVLST